jgi:hypothetical protein
MKKTEVAKKMKLDKNWDYKSHREIKEPSWKVKSGKKTVEAFTALAKKNNNWETKDTL